MQELFTMAQAAKELNIQKSNINYYAENGYLTIVKNASGIKLVFYH